MKTVFSKTIDVAKIWATQSQPDARTGSNTRCKGALLISYGTVIARLIETKEGVVALISQETYSSTTAVTIGQAKEAAFINGIAAFRVSDVGGWGPFAQSCHDTNLVGYAERINEALDKLEKAQRFNGGRYRSEALKLIGTAHLYARIFKLKWTWKGRNPLTLRSKTETTEGF